MEVIKMADDLTKKIPQDASKVNINQAYEVAYWCKTFGCTEAQLIAAVGKVGAIADKVRAHLGK